MKKFLFLFIFLLELGVYAQLPKNDFGLRLGYGNYGTSAELSSRHKMLKTYRFEMNAGLRYKVDYQDYIANIYFHFNFPIAGKVNFYVGPGYQFSYYKNRSNGATTTEYNFALGGQIGIERQFKRLTLSFDLRSNFDLYKEYWFAHVFALGLRYQIN